MTNRSPRVAEPPKKALALVLQWSPLFPGQSAVYRVPTITQSVQIRGRSWIAKTVERSSEAA